MSVCGTLFQGISWHAHNPSVVRMPVLWVDCIHMFSLKRKQASPYTAGIIRMPVSQL